jgi:hypothetical protein
MYLGRPLKHTQVLYGYFFEYESCWLDDWLYELYVTD